LFLERHIAHNAGVRGALQHFAQELARRRVVRVLIAYVLGVFGALQGLDIMVSRLELPGVWMRWAVLLALAGLPAAAVLSWIFDWTREGDWIVDPLNVRHSDSRRRRRESERRLVLT
jgi:6-phosphogluconate dehydrogenase